MTTEHPPTNNKLPEFRFDHAGVRVENFDEAIAWYQSKLELELLHRFNSGNLELAILVSASGAFKIELLSLPRESSTVQAGSWGWDHVCLSVDNVDIMLETLKRKGIKIDRGPFVVAHINRKIAFFSDPWGNIFEVIGPVS